MAVEGVGTWILLLAGGVPMPALLGLLTGILAFLPNIGAIVSGALIILIGFSVNFETGLWAVAVYAIVQIVDGYFIVPYVARKTVDLAPALVLGAQVVFGALFGIMGLALADPIIAMMKARSSRNPRTTSRGRAAARRPRRRREPRPPDQRRLPGGGPAGPARRPFAMRPGGPARSAWPPGAAALLHLLHLLHLLELLHLQHRRRARRDIDDLDVEHQGLVGAEGSARRGRALIAELRRNPDPVARALAHQLERLAEAGNEAVGRRLLRLAVQGAGENRATLAAADEMDAQRVVRGDELALAGADDLILQARLVVIRCAGAVPTQASAAPAAHSTIKSEPQFEHAASGERADRHGGDGGHGRSPKRNGRRLVYRRPLGMHDRQALQEGSESI